MKRFRLLALALLVCACDATTPAEPEPLPPHNGLTIRVRVPATTPDDGHVYIAGGFNGWHPAQPAYRLEREPGGTHVIRLQTTIRGVVEFKFTLGSWETVEQSASGADIPNRQLVVPQEGPFLHEATVAAWKTGGSGHTTTGSVSILDASFAMPQLGRDRRVWLYLPPDYATSGNRRYAVLYMHDGQNVFDAATSFVGEWGVDETLDSLHAAGELSLIVVAVDHGGEHRFDEYNPWTFEGDGGEGDEYLDFLVETLKPYVDARYRTRADRLNTGVAGSSMGGLISFYAMIKYPEVFGRAGVFSPAFWTAKPDVFEYASGRAPVRPDPRLFMVSGAREDGSSEIGRYEEDQMAMVDTLAATGWAIGTDAEVAAHISPDGEHSEWFWRREFPSVVLWLFGDR